MADFGPVPFDVPARDGKPAEALVMRACRPEDADIFIPFWKNVSAESTHTLQTLDFPPELEKVRENWQRTIADPRALKLGVYAGPRLVAQLGVYHGGDHPWTKHIVHFGMMVLREYWGRGVGRRLLAELEAFAHSVGALKIEAQVRVANERGLKLYTTAGYRIEGQRSRAAKIAGQFQDEYWIAKDLDA